MYNTSGSGASHVALYVDSASMIHAASAGSPTGVIHQSQSESYWTARLMGYRTFVGVSVTKSKSPFQNLAINDLPVEITKSPRKTAEALPVLTGSALRFTVTNNSGAAGDFDLCFYRAGTPKKDGQTETMSVPKGKSGISGAFICEETGQYLLEIAAKEGGKTLVEYAFNTVE